MIDDLVHKVSKKKCVTVILWLFTVINRKEKQQILNVKKLEPANHWPILKWKDKQEKICFVENLVY